MKSTRRKKTEAKKLVEEQREMLKQSRVEAQELIERAKTSCRSKDVIVAAKEAESIKASAVQEIQREKSKHCCFTEQVASLSVQIASKVIEKELKDQVKLIRDYIKEVGEAR